MLGSLTLMSKGNVKRFEARFCVVQGALNMLTVLAHDFGWKALQ